MLPIEVLPIDVLPIDVLPIDVLPIDVLPIDVLPIDVLEDDVEVVVVHGGLPCRNGCVVSAEHGFPDGPGVACAAPVRVNSYTPPP